MGAMTESENKPVAYPEYDENGKPNPLRVPLSAESEQWEIENAYENGSLDNGY